MLVFFFLLVFNRVCIQESGSAPSHVAHMFQNLSFRLVLIKPSILECYSLFLIITGSEARDHIEGFLAAMQFCSTVVVILATLLLATVDAKIYERCELARKLEKAGLNGFKGYTVGDCKIPIAPSLIHPNLPISLRNLPISLSTCTFFILFWGRDTIFSVTI